MPSGRFARSIPKAIGKSSSGSNFLTIARYRSTQAITIINTVFHHATSLPASIFVRPVLPMNFEKPLNSFSNNFNHSILNLKDVKKE